MYDAIVLGLGGMGSAAACHLARRGVRVLGLEQFRLGHALGSSHGRSRIIRTAYYEHPDYIPLLFRAFELWRELEHVTHQALLAACDCVTIGRPDGELITGMNLAKSRLPAGAVSTLTSAELAQFGFTVPVHFVGERETQAGILNVEACVAAHQAEARRLGTTLREQEQVLHWHADANTVTVQTTHHTYTAAKLIITAGPWSQSILNDLGIPLAVMRQVMTWFAPRRPMRIGDFPIFLLETPAGEFYGMPALDAHGVKVARHYGAAEQAHPDVIERTALAADVDPIRHFADTYLPNSLGDCLEKQTCIYTLTPDRHFVIDHHPQHANVCVAAGFSGHGFKFAPVVGEILADLALNGRTRHPIDMFTRNRFG